ncbi:phosphate ABC transporter substrate-binding protein PstS family protein [Lactobacillus sp. S2-2]|uniref:phosphate ABC transporter substrate-binding protein n=1 Tax=Lactobacillus sp. S2-2 TaxID=2692917 RepID=UPI001F1A81F5|nr:phosphate ABC transporter substrate-binding protein [Lactobacillus sp. S2-2]MCF6515320.1 phosphate ABC transporter substrate-binding protein PstS family protein [Lactobacillus sp. S2-2]
MKKYSLLIAMGLLLLIISGCGNKNNPNKVTSVGSTAMQPLVEQSSLDYKKNNEAANITVQGGGSGTGLSQVSQGAVSIGNSDVFAEEKEGINAKDLVDHKIAVVGIVPVVNPSAGVKNLSLKQLRDIFAGKITNWKQVGGKNQAITIINRSQGSGTRSTFEKTALKGVKSVKAQEQDANGTVDKIVSATPGTISYLSIPYLRISKKLQGLSIDNVKPSYENIAQNKWKIWSYEHMYTKKKTNQATKKFIDYLQSVKVQNGLVREAGYVSIHDMKFEALADGKVIKK